MHLPSITRILLVAATTTTAHALYTRDELCFRYRALSEAAFRDINHFLRPGHLQQLASILDDPEASENDRYVAMEYLKNASIAAGGVLPMCQDTGTDIITAKKGRRVWTPGADEQALGQGGLDAYAKNNLRYSQLAPLSMYEEANTRTNLPAQIDIAQEGGEGEGVPPEWLEEFVEICRRAFRYYLGGGLAHFPRGPAASQLRI